MFMVHALHICDTAQIGHPCCMYCDVCLCRCGFKSRW